MASAPELRPRPRRRRTRRDPRVGARENNLQGVDVEIPKRRLTVFTGVSGSGKSSLVFGTIANESQRLINETYPTFIQQFMGQLSRPDVDALENISPAIVVDQERMGANARSTVGTATDVHAMLRLLFSRIGQPHVGSPQAFSFNVPSSGRRRHHHRDRRGQGQEGTAVLRDHGRHVPGVRGPRAGRATSTSTNCSTGRCRCCGGAIRCPATRRTAGW
jgi:energy-coupling factor transporter ATP-binding protein EcfA2